MPVKRFLETKLFKLLTYSISDRKINSSELSVAYDDFVRQLFLFCQNEQDIIQYFISNKSGIWSLSLIVHSKG